MSVFMLKVLCLDYTGKVSFLVHILVMHLVELSFLKVQPLPKKTHLPSTQLLIIFHFSGEHFITQSYHVPVVICYSQIASVSGVISETPSSTARGSVKARQKAM